MLIRYAMLVALAASAVWAVISLSTSDAQLLLADAGQRGQASNVAFWLLAAVATLISLSLCRFVVFGLPSMVDGWYQEHKSWFYMILFGGLAYAAFYLM
ncbi:MAG: hypothetical protein JJE37_02835 [Methyloceanibacter sp.]|jgi:hypothetical protein|nr:hypothetical protein [Methyloceanibacter sp.]